MVDRDFFSDERSVVEDGAIVGSGTSIWHFAHLRSGSLIGRDCVIGKGVYIDTGVKIGDNCKVQNGVSIYDGVQIEDRVFVGPHAVFTNDLRPRADIWNEDRLSKTMVRQGASIGANATVRCGIEIGEWCMIAAGSVVTKNVPPHALIVGVPGRIVGWVTKTGAKLNITVEEGRLGGTFTSEETGETVNLEALEG